MKVPNGVQSFANILAVQYNLRIVIDKLKYNFINLCFTVSIRTSLNLKENHF